MSAVLLYLDFADFENNKFILLMSQLVVFKERQNKHFYHLKILPFDHPQFKIFPKMLITYRNIPLVFRHSFLVSKKPL